MNQRNRRFGIEYRFFGDELCFFSRAIFQLQVWKIMFLSWIVELLVHLFMVWKMNFLK